jgi:hypothetical protein
VGSTTTKNFQKLLTNRIKYVIIYIEKTKEIDQMKVTATLTKKEYADTYNLVWFDPCKHIDCSAIQCEACPLQKVVEKLRDAQSEYMQVISHLPKVDE